MTFVLYVFKGDCKRSFNGAKGPILYHSRIYHYASRCHVVEIRVFPVLHSIFTEYTCGEVMPTHYQQHSLPTHPKITKGYSSAHSTPPSTVHLILFTPSGQAIFHGVALTTQTRTLALAQGNFKSPRSKHLVVK